MRARSARNLLGLIVWAALFAGSHLAAAEPEVLARRVEELRALVVAEPEAPERLFTAAFTRQVPPAQMVQILVQYFRQGGKVVRAERVAERGEHAGEYRFVTETGATFPVQIALDASPPHLIQGLLFGPMSAPAGSVTEVVEGLKALPGQVSLAWCALGEQGVEPLTALDPDRRLAIGSTFKIYVLGALVQAIERGDARWDEVIRLREEWRSWPSGVLHEWPVGSPLTLHTLATQMISISDNTAADHLLFRLGRERVEKELAAMGHGEPARTLPFLSTFEMFHLKERGKAAERAAAYAALDLAGRRRLLADLAEKGRGDRESFSGIEARPVAVEGIEWFASVLDLCRAMDWLRRHTEAVATAPARGTLAVNPGLAFDGETWPYVGYKGGSEAGVLNLTWLLQRADGRWFALVTSWNNPADDLDPARLLALMQSFIDLVGDPTEAAPSLAGPAAAAGAGGG